MDYQKIYISLISKSRKENRKKGCGIYYETHHIMPDFMFHNRKRKGPKGHLPGDPDERSNVILLTPREHYFAHILLCKIYKGQRYEYPCLLSLLVMTSGGKKGSQLNVNRNRISASLKESRLYQIMREKAVNAISQARQGTMPAKDLDTGELVGSVACDHPNVISGKWVHHSHGAVFSQEHRDKLRIKGTGLSNPNASGYEDEVYLQSFIDLCKKAGRTVPHGLWKLYCVKHSLPTFKACPKFRQALFDRMLTDGKEETGIGYVYEDWFMKNRKGTPLYHEVKSKWV